MIKKTLSREEALALAEKMMAHDIVIYGPKVAVIRDAEEDMFGGIILGDVDKKKPIRGRVVMTGLGINTEDKDDILSGMRIGDLVYFTKYNPVLFEIPFPDGEVEVEVMHASDIYMGMRDGPRYPEEITGFDQFKAEES